MNVVSHQEHDNAELRTLTENDDLGIPPQKKETEANINYVIVPCSTFALFSLDLIRLGSLKTVEFYTKT